MEETEALHRLLRIFRAGRLVAAAYVAAHRRAEVGLVELDQADVKAHRNLAVGGTKGIGNCRQAKQNKASEVRLRAL